MDLLTRPDAGDVSSVVGGVSSAPRRTFPWKTGTRGGEGANAAGKWEGGGAMTIGTQGGVHRRRQGLCPSADASIAAATPPSPQHAPHTGHVRFPPASLTASRRRAAPKRTATSPRWSSVGATTTIGTPSRFRKTATAGSSGTATMASETRREIGNHQGTRASATALAAA